MKRWILCGLIVILVAIPLLADDQPAITYELASQTFAEMLDLLDGAIQLTAAAIMTADSVATKDYVQAVLNLLEGPDSELYDSENSVDTFGTPGLIPLMDGLRYTDSRQRGYEGAPLAIIYPEVFEVGGGWTRDAALFAQAWKSVSLGLQAASAVAQDIEQSPYNRAPWDDELQTLYAHLITIYGAEDDSFPIGGLTQLSDLFPPREQWARRGESVQAAIDRTPAGGIVHIEPGTYREAIVIDKSLTLIAGSDASDDSAVLGPVVIAGSFWGVYAMTIESDIPIDVTIQGIELRDTHGGITVEGPVTLHVSDVKFENNRTGLSLARDSETIVENCQFVDNSTAVLLVTDCSATLRDCVIQGSTDWYGAIVVNSRTDLRIENCDIIDNQGAGVNALMCSTLHMIDSRLLRNGDGLHVTPGGCPDENGMPVREWPEKYPDVTGWGNVIPGPGEPDGNHESAIDDSVYGGTGIDLSFLTQPKPDSE
jgi:hypothetical protein